MTGSEKGDEFRRREGCLSQDRAQRAGSELTVQRDDDRATVPAELHVAASLADLLIAHLGKSDDDSSAADDGERRAHAVSWTVAMMGGSMSSGSAASSKDLRPRHPRIRTSIPWWRGRPSPWRADRSRCAVRATPSEGVREGR